MTGISPASGPETAAQHEERVCTCGAGHGSLEGHADWCDFIAYQALPSGADIRPENVARHLDLLHNHEAGLIPVATRNLLEALAARLAEVEAEAGKMLAEADHDYNRKTNAMIARHAEVVGTLKRSAEAAEARAEKLAEALVDHNDLLRSAMQIAKREGVEGEIGTTNWDAYYNRVAVVLKRHHETANTARTALEESKT